MQYKILCVIGTRPEALKMAPVITKLKAIPSLIVTTLVTGQHQDLVYQAIKMLNINIDKDFAVMVENQSLSELTSNLLQKMNAYYDEITPDLVIAQGDTATTYVAALVSFYRKIPFAHVEAGLRTYNFHAPFPEEFYRQSISKLAALHFAPTIQSKQNLLKEGIAENSIFVTGNTIIDTLLTFTNNQAKSFNTNKLIFITCHRRESFGKPLNDICAAIKTLALKFADIEFVFSIHPNPNLKSHIYKALDGIGNIRLVAALDYISCVTLLQQCYLVLTDSGGLQEECPALQKPVLVLRNETERVEAIECGAAKLIGTETNSIIFEVERLIVDVALYQTMANAGSPYGDGKAAEYIAQHLWVFFQQQAVNLHRESVAC